MADNDLKIERQYEAQLDKYQEEARVPLSSYNDLEKKYDELQCQVKDLISYIENNDPAGAYEYAVSEGLV